MCDDSKRRLLDYIDFTETGIVRMDLGLSSVCGKFCEPWHDSGDEGSCRVMGHDEKLEGKPV